MNLKFIIPFCALLIAGATFGAEEAQKPGENFVRVFVFDASSKPSVAATNGRYEWRQIDKDAKHAMMCDDCMTKVTAAGTKPAVKVVSEKCEAYLCAKCGTMVWRDKGKELQFSEKTDVEALGKISAELKKGRDNTTKPAAASNIGK